MVKVKMLARFGGAMGRKFEKGVTYSLPPAYAEQLIAAGLAELITEAEPEPEPILEVLVRPEVKEPPKSKAKSKSKVKK